MSLPMEKFFGRFSNNDGLATALVVAALVVAFAAAGAGATFFALDGAT